MTEYVLGFYFNHRTDVVLIGKTKPPWQAGKFNGVGGKIEEGEDCWTAMLREFKEETGVETSIDDWAMKVCLSGQDWLCYVFAGHTDSEYFTVFKQEEEIPVIRNVNRLPENVIPNLRWLIPLCLDQEVRGITRVQYVS